MLKDASLNNATKDTLFGHYTITGFPENGAFFTMALLTNLGNFKHDILEVKPIQRLSGIQGISFRGNILSKLPHFNFPSVDCCIFSQAFYAQQANLPVP